MTSLSITTIIDIWSELEQCLHGTNGYGGNTAEIYVYRLLPCRPGGDRGDDYPVARKSFHDVLALFCERRSCSIAVDGRKLGKWLISCDNTHRFHVMVKARRGR